MSRAYRYFAMVIGVVCLASLVYILLFSRTRTVFSDILQGVLLGFGAAFVTAQIVARFKITRVNGWTTMLGLGEPGNGMFVRAASAQVFPGPVNSEREAVYWWTNVDGAGHALNGQNDYVLRFPAGGLPPNNAFWSLTMGDSKNHFVPNAIHRYSVGDRSGLVPNADGSVDVCIQHDAPAGQESNWLPSPPGAFILWLRVYEPGPSILDGTYRVPPVARAEGRPA